MVRNALLGVIFHTAAFGIDLALPPAIQDGFLIGVPECAITGTASTICQGAGVRNIGVDRSGDFYLAGVTYGTTFSVAYTAVLGPGGGGQDLFIAKVSHSGQQLLYLTQIGGSGVDDLGGMAVDQDGNVYLAGTATSDDFPVTAGTLRTAFTKGSSFILKLNPSGNRLVFGTFLDDSIATHVKALAVDEQATVYVGGVTDGQSFPTTAGAYMGGVPPPIPFFPRTVGFVSKLSADGRVLLFSTLFGGTKGFDDSVTGLTIDASGRIHIAGRAGATDFPITGAGPVQPVSFFALLDRTGSQLLYSTPISDYSDLRIAVDANGNSYVAGNILLKFDSAGALLYKRYLGAELTGVVPLNDGGAVMVGQTGAPDFPTRDTLLPCSANLPRDSAAVSPSPFPGVNNAVLIRLDSAGNLVHSSMLYFGSNTYIRGLALGPDGSLYLAGSSDSTLLPVGPILIPARSQPPNSGFGFAFRLDWQQIHTGLPAPSCMVSGATLAPVPAAPLTVATLFGSHLGPASGVQYLLDAEGRVPTQLAGTSVTVGDTPAPVLYAQDQQVNFIIPGGLTGDTTTICVEVAGVKSCLFAYVATYAPGILRMGNNYAVQNQDGTLNTPANPAARGSIITIYGTGFGPYTRSVPDGRLAELSLNPLSHPPQAFFRNDPTCMGGGAFCYPGPRGTVPGDVLFAGASPLIVNGVTVINVRIPEGVYSAPWSGPLSLVVDTAGSYSLPTAGLTVAIK